MTNAEEIVLAERSGALMPGDFSPKAVMGRTVLTTHRLVFTQQKYNAGAGGAAGGVLGAVVADRMQKRHEANHGPLVDLPVEAIGAVSKAKFRLNRDVLVIGLADGRELRLSGTFKHLEPAIRELVTTRLGKRIVEGSEGAWQVV